MKQPVSTEGAPKAIGPYTQAVIHNGIVYASGQIPLDPASGQIVEGGIEEQTTRSLENIKAVLEAAGSGLDAVLKTTVYLRDIADFPKMNEVYARYFTGVAPARSTIQAGALPRNARVEIDAVAAVKA